MPSSTIQFGLLLPHFSRHCTWDRLIGFAPRIEALGFDSVWARDHVGFTGHAFEGSGPTYPFVDCFTTLTAVASVTQRLKLGTSVLIPFRHPLVTAQLFGSLSWVSHGRVEAGLAPGGLKTPTFNLLGIPLENRVQLCQETAEVIRLTARHRQATYRGALTSFENATIDPAPPPHMPIWYGGASNASIRRVLEYADGMLAGRCPFRRLDVALERLRAGAAERGKLVKVASTPFISIGPTYEQALGKLNLPSLLDLAQQYWKTPFESAQDLAGALVVGTSEQCIAQVQQFVDRGEDLVIFDARLRMDAFEEIVEQIGQEVLPAFR